MNDVLSNILRFIIMVMVQVLLVNNLQVFSMCYPMIYIYFLLILPPSLPRVAELLIAFACGLVMDIFCDSLGLHTAVCTLIGFVRPQIITAMVTDYERVNLSIGIQSLGMATFVKYVTLITILHHVTFFMLESFSLAHWHWLLLRILVSSIVTIAFILAIEMVRNRIR